MRVVLTVVVLFFSTLDLTAQDSLLVMLNKKQFNQGDTLIVDCLRKSKNNSPATFNVWIQDLRNYKTWKFRYPFLDSSIFLDLKISDSLPAGNYAVNFFMQPQLFSLLGKIKHYKKDLKTLTMLMMAKNRENYYATLEPDEDGNFTTGKLVFEDTAKFIFYPANKKRRNLYINISTYLDSNYIPAKVLTEFIEVGDVGSNKFEKNKYSFNESIFFENGTMLPNVTMVNVEPGHQAGEVNKTMTVGLFKKEARVFDGFNNPEMAASPDIFSYLSKQVLGMTLTPYGGGFYMISRRGFAVDVFIDEVNVNFGDMPYINPSDVAMIKVFEPYTGPGLNAGGGTIAIYTKTKNYRPNPNRRNIFLAKGFSPTSTVWK